VLNYLILLISMLAIYTALDLLFKKRTDVIDNLAFIIPLVLTKVLYDVSFHIVFVGYLLGMIVAVLFYAFIFLPRYLRLSK